MKRRRDPTEIDRKALEREMAALPAPLMEFGRVFGAVLDYFAFGKDVPADLRKKYKEFKLCPSKK